MRIVRAIEKNKKTNRRKRSGMCFLGIILIFYLLFLIRVILFRQVSIDNLAAAIGAGNRSISLIPAHSVVQMISSEVSVLRMAGSVAGSAALFLPLGLLFPLFFPDFSAAEGTEGGKKKRNEGGTDTGAGNDGTCGRGKSAKKIVMEAAALGAAVSASFEAVQYLFRMGGSDIDDVLLGAAGAAAGCGVCLLLFRISRKKRIVPPAVSAAVLALILLLIGSGILISWDSGRLLLGIKDSSVRNGQLVESFAGTEPAAEGEFVSLSGRELTVGDPAAGTKDRETYHIGEESGIYVRRITLDCLFGMVIGEYTSYEKMEQESLNSTGREVLRECSGVRIWSEDGRTADFIVITLIS